MDEDATIAYIANSAQVMLSESYNFTNRLDGPGSLKAVDAGEVRCGRWLGDGRGRACCEARTLRGRSCCHQLVAFPPHNEHRHTCCPHLPLLSAAGQPDPAAGPPGPVRVLRTAGDWPLRHVRESYC